MPTETKSAESLLCNKKQVGHGSFGELARTSPRELWLIFALKALWSLAEFSLGSVLVLFFSEDLGMNDELAGWIYGLTGLAKVCYGLVCGFGVDIIGIRLSLLAGSFLMTLGLLIIASSHSTFWVISTLLTVKALGSALLLSPMMFAIRRVTEPECRAFAFSLFYVIMNGSAFAAQILVNVMRNSKDYLPAHGADGATLWRLVIWMAVIFGASTFLLTFCFREADDKKDSEGEKTPKDVVKMTMATLSEAKFWRLTMLSLIFVGVRLVFVHLHATFPKFWTRTVGHEAPFELIIAVNPACIMVLVPIFTYVAEQLRQAPSSVLIAGAFFTGISPLWLAWHASYATAIAFVIFLSFGEALWSPKLYEYAVAVSPVGREGTYSALSTVPLFASHLFAGGFSGYLVQEHCPSSQRCDGRPIWLLVALTTLTSPLLLLTFRTCLFKADDIVKDKEADQPASYGGVSHQQDPESHQEHK